MFSSRTRSPAVINALTHRCRALREAGVPLFDLTPTNPTEVGLFDNDNWLPALSAVESAHYRPEPFGLLSARQAVTRYYATKGLHIDPRQVVLCGSTSEAYSWIFKLLTDPGESILIPRPSYPLLEHLASYSDARTAQYMIGYDGAYYIDIDSIKEQVSRQTKALVLISPNNPTGSFTRRAELDALLQLNIPIISDEVFSDYCLMASRPDLPSALVADTSLVFALGGLSKSCALPQLKLAWMVVGGQAELREQALIRLELIADTFLSPNTPVQVALPQLLDFGAQRHAQVKQRLHCNAATLRQLTANSAVDVLPAQGGWSAALKLPLTVSEDWALLLLEELHVLVQPGWFYDFTDDRIVVVSLLTRENDFAHGIERLVSRASRDVAV